MIEKKLCGKCHKTKAIDLFFKDSQKKDGVYSSCKDCYRKRLGIKKRIAREKIVNGIKKSWCTECKEYKEQNLFYTNVSSNNGIHYQCKKCSIKRAKSENAKIGQKSRRQLQRMQVLLAYGNKCSCCNESENKFLSIDHIDGGGNKHRRNIGNGHFYSWVIKNGFPNNLQILCYNCNLAKGFYGQCPHKENATNTI